MKESNTGVPLGHEPTPLRWQPFVSSLLLGLLGFFAGAFTGALFTVFVYFIGSWIGAPVGAMQAARHGWRTPLRDAVIAFFLYVPCLLFALYFNTGSGSPEEQILKLLIAGILTGPVGLYLPRLPFHRIAFATRRTIALVLLGIWGILFCGWVYWLLWLKPM